VLARHGALHFELGRLVPGARREEVAPAQSLGGRVDAEHGGGRRVDAQERAVALEREEAEGQRLVGDAQLRLGAPARGALVAHLLADRERGEQAGGERRGDAVHRADQLLQPERRGEHLVEPRAEHDGERSAVPERDARARDGEDAREQEAEHADAGRGGEPHDRQEARERQEECGAEQCQAAPARDVQRPGVADARQVVAEEPDEQRVGEQDVGGDRHLAQRREPGGGDAALEPLQVRAGRDLGETQARHQPGGEEQVAGVAVDRRSDQHEGREEKQPALEQAGIAMEASVGALQVRAVPL
jgi:hypothetical protein